MVSVETLRRDHPVDSPRRSHGLRPLARGVLGRIPLDDLDVLDLGTGKGRLAFLLAPRCRSVTGIDIDARKIERAEEIARAKGVSNVRFRAADAEQVDYRTLVPRLSAVVANLCMSLEMVRRSGAALGPGGHFAFTCFHPEQWKETGAGTSHAIDPDALIEAASRVGLAFVEGLVEVDAYPFSSARRLVELYVKQGSRGRKWERDGRLASLVESARRGTPRVTEAYFTARFEKRPRGGAERTVPQVGVSQPNH
jgi:SAM-dependent methyltransferase